jgi:APA family basic amino acid/polyamine antiporter
MGAAIAALTLLGDLKATWSFSAFTVLLYYGLTNLSALRLAPKDRRFPRAIPAAGLLSCLTLAFFVPWRVWIIGLALLAVGFGLRALSLWRHRQP